MNVKPNFEENKSLTNFIIIKPQRMHRKTHKSQDYLLFPRMLAEHLPHLCSSFDIILSSGNFCSMHREGLGCARTAVGAALQHSQLSSAWSAPHCWMGAVAVSQLSAQPVTHGAGSKYGTLTVLAGVSQSGIHSWVTAIGKRGKKTFKKTKTPQTKTQTPKTKTLNKQKFHYPCSRHAASKQLPKFLNLSRVQQKQNNSATQYNSTVTGLPLQSTTSSSKHLPHLPLLPSIASHLKHREQIELHWGNYTQALKGLHSTDTDGLQSGVFL